MAHQRHGIRANLCADREHQKNYRKRANQESFGIYRPLTDESTDKVWEVVSEAKKDIKSYFGEYRNSPAELVVPAELGVTFVERRKVRRAMNRGLLERFQLVELGRILQRVESKTSEVSTTEVQLGQTDWYSEQERKLVFCFQEGTSATSQLAEQTELVEQMLEGAKGGELHVQQPTHVTLFKYGRARDGKDLSYEHKDMVGEIIEDHFRSSNVGSIVLGPLIIGDSYSVPKVLA